MTLEIGPDITVVDFALEFKDDVPDAFRAALLHSTVVFLDELRIDVADLAYIKRDSKSQALMAAIEQTAHISRLPEQFRRYYNWAFADAFRFSAYSVTERLAGDSWQAPMTTAEAIALACIAEDAHDLLSDATELLKGYVDETGKPIDLLGDRNLTDDAYRTFSDIAFEDRDFEWLYDPSFDGIEDDVSLTEFMRSPNLHPNRWFVSTRNDRCIHPALTISELQNQSKD